MRNDVHRPSAIEPSDYSYLGSFVMDPPVGPDGEMMVPEEMLATYPQEHLDGVSFAELLHKSVSPDRAYPVEGDDPFMGYQLANRERCDHCGAHLNYVAVYRHNPSNQCIAVGHDCADNTMSMDSRRALDAKRQRDLMAAGRQNAEKEAERLENLMLTRETYPEAYEILNRYDGPNSFISDVAGKLAKWGNLSEGQARAVVNAHQRDLERAAKKANGEIKPVPEGKGVVVEGQVIKTDVKDNGFTMRFVMTVKTDDGWCVWGTVPKALEQISLGTGNVYDTREVQRGERVRFVANLERSNKSDDFGFFQRPRKAELVEG